MKTRQIKIGTVCIGGDNPVAVQSMTNTDTKDVEGTVAQIKELEKARCDIVRCAIYDQDCAQSIPKIKDQISIPLVADVHFDSKIAVAAIENGADKLRINPGNIGGERDIKRVVDAARMHHIPIRVGANAGSLSKQILQKHGGPTAAALVESAEENIRLLEKFHFEEIVVSIKSSNVPVCVQAYRAMAELVDYPLHLGVTEAGTYNSAIIKSSMALGALLMDGIGDTIRVSITGDPVMEIYAAKDILKTSGLRKGGVEIISCPTCARCTLDIETIAKEIETFTKEMEQSLKVAIMGCAVNGPGEAKEADIGIAGGRQEALLFANGKTLRKVDEQEITAELKEMILDWIAKKEGTQSETE